MGTGYADRIFIALHDHAPGLRAFENGDSQCACCCDLGIVVVGGCCADNAVCSLDVVGFVADVDRDAFLNQFVCGYRRIHVGTGNGQALGSKDQSEWTHGYAANANQMCMHAGL